MFKNVAAKFIVFAFDATTNVPKTGDAANITAYVSKDYGSVTVLADTSATEMDATNAPGYYLFDAAQGETNADCLLVSAKSATSNIKVLGAPAAIYTRPTTGWLAPTTAGRTLDVTATGEAGIDWSNVGAPTTTLDLSGTTIKTTQKVDVDTIKTQAVTLSGGVTIPAATLASTTNITTATGVDITKILGTAISTPATAGILDVNVKNIDNDAASASGTVTFPNATLASTTNITAATGIDVTKLLGTAWLTPGVAGTPDVNTKLIGGTAPNALIAGRVDAVTSIRSNTAQAGAAGSITLDASASAVDAFYFRDLIFLTGGTGVGQVRRCTTYTGATKVALVGPNWTTTPDNTTTFTIVPFTGVDVLAVSGTLQSAGDIVGIIGTPAGASLAADVAADKAVDDAIKITTDKFVFTVANQVDANALALATTLRPGIRKNTALAAFEILMTDSTNHNPATGLTVTVTRSIDGAAFGALAVTTVTEIANGWYKFDFAASDLNGTVIGVRATATGADDLAFTIKTSP